MLDYFVKSRLGIAGAIDSILEEQGGRLGGVSALGSSLALKLRSFSHGGKMIRGSLVRLGYELCSGSAKEADSLLDRAGAAMEFFQAGLLVHDDIMDRDSVRRGMPTIHAQYQAESRSPDPAHSGLSLGICAGDVAFFVGAGVLASLPAESPESGERIRAVSAFAASELCLVGVAQMQDVQNGDCSSGSEPSEEDILKLYRYKTGRYTFSLPLVVGAMLAGAPSEAVRALDEAGEYLGLVFQLKDDELGLFADPRTLGKVPGSDIRENKKTLHRRYLFDRSPSEARSVLSGIFSKVDLNQDDIDAVRGQMDALSVRRDIAVKMAGYAALAQDRLDAVPVLRSGSVAAREAFIELREYSLSRES